MKTKETPPGLFGIKHSNRDFEQKDSWGKNQFNSSFPIALAILMEKKGLENNYLLLGADRNIIHDTISTSELYGMNPHAEELFYSFETAYSPYLQLVKGNLPRIDLVTQNTKTGVCMKYIEVKLTALPDNSTYTLPIERQGTEIIIRHDTIVYLACSIAFLYKNDFREMAPFFGKDFAKITDWTDAQIVAPYIPEMLKSIDRIVAANISKQEPLILQALWKTEGYLSRLSEACLDTFVWSNFAFIELFTTDARKQERPDITRQGRTIVWLFKMLYDFSKTGQFHHEQIIEELTYNSRNDKAFSANGRVSFPFMESKELLTPRVKTNAIKEIIVGGGQTLLSPERRLDSIIFNTPGLF